MIPSQIAEAIAAAVRARYPALRVEVHGGNFTEREVPMLLAQAPAILVAITRLSGVGTQETPEKWRAVFRIALFVLANDTATTERDVVAIDTSFDLLKWIPAQRWGLAEALLPENDSLSADNLYTGTINNLRVALWGLAWTQPFQTLHLT